MGRHVATMTVFILRKVTVLTVECEDVIQLFLFSRLLQTLPFHHHLAKTFLEARHDFLFEEVGTNHGFVSLCTLVVEFLVAAWHTQVEEPLGRHFLQLHFQFFCLQALLLQRCIAQGTPLHRFVFCKTARV